MNKQKLEIKLSFVTGLKEIVLEEISQHSDLRVIKKGEDFVYLDFIQDFTQITLLKSVLRAYITTQDSKHNPSYLSNHKSILGDIINVIIVGSKHKFNTFKISVAGADSASVRGLAEYVQKTYKLVEKEDADIKIHIAKIDSVWEVGAQITPRPLSLREYKEKNMRGAMDPTIAYAVNSQCKLEKANSYLNVFSGSATLLIEAGQCYPNLKQLIGFDNNKKSISLSMQNIKKAGLLKRVQLKEKDIFIDPNLGKFDAITSDLPFGMAISKNEDLGVLYRCFVEYCQEALNQDGTLAVYTSEHEILERVILESKFKIVKTLELKFTTSVNSYLRPKIFVCRLK